MTAGRAGQPGPCVPGLRQSMRRRKSTILLLCLASCAALLSCSASASWSSLLARAGTGSRAVTSSGCRPSQTALTRRSMAQSAISVQSQAATESFMSRMRALALDALTWPHLNPQQRLEWAAALRLDVVPVREMPASFLEKHGVTRQDISVDLLSLDGKTAVLCNHNGSVSTKSIRRFLRISKSLFNASRRILVVGDSSLQPQPLQALLEDSSAEILVLSDAIVSGLATEAPKESSRSHSKLKLRSCQLACLDAIDKGARIIQMACGTGKTMVIQELATRQKHGKVLVIVPTQPTCIGF